MRIYSFGLVVCVACGGGGSTGDDSGTMTDGSVTTDGTSPTDGTVSDQQNPQDTGNDGMNMTPMGQVSCGGATCMTPMQYCCQGMAMDGGSALSCVMGGGACNKDGRRMCDDKADCPMGEVCCYEANNGLLGSSCRATCGMNRVQACKTSPECQMDGGMCAMHSCMGGAGTVMTCAPIPNVCP